MGNVKDTAEAIQGIAKAVPVYQDLLQPAVKELGKGIHTLSKTVHIALSPVSALVWGYEQVKDVVQVSLEKKLAKIPKENIIPPAPEIAVPTIEALRYAGYQEDLRALFINLLASSMDSSSSKTAHPSFVEIIKQLNVDEAKIIQLFNLNSIYPVINVHAVVKENLNHYSVPIKDFSLLPFQTNCNYPEQGPAYLGNLSRLGLISISYVKQHIDPSVYDEVENHQLSKIADQLIQKKNMTKEIKRGIIQLTDFGHLFINSCVAN